MQITINMKNTGKGYTTDGMSEAAQKSFKGLEPFVKDGVIHITCENVARNELHLTGRTCLPNGREIVVTIAADDYYYGVERLADKVKETYLQQHDKITDKRGRLGVGDEIPTKRQVARKHKQIVIEHLKEDEAFDRMDALEKESFVFYNSDENGKLCMIRRDAYGDYELVMDVEK